MKRINYKIVVLFLGIVSLLVCGVFFLPTLRCKVRGGNYMKVGMLDKSMCIFQYSDARKECYNSNECEGRCIYFDQGDTRNKDSDYYEWAMSYRPGDKLKVVGFCKEDNSPFDCTAEVIDGHIHAPIVCVD